MRRRRRVTADELHPSALPLCICPDCIKAGGKPRRLVALRMLAHVRHAFRLGRYEGFFREASS